MTSHWLRDTGPGTRAMLVLTAVLAVLAVALHLVGRGDPEVGS